MVFLFFFSFLAWAIDCRVAFSPGGSSVPLIRSVLECATSRVDVAMFYLSNDEIVNSLCSVASERGVKVRFITDVSMSEPANRPILDKLHRCGVCVHVVTIPQGKMHLKCAVIDGQTVLTGAANWSTAADQSNYEDALAIHSAIIAEKYLRRIDELAVGAEDFSTDFGRAQERVEDVSVAGHQQKIIHVDDIQTYFMPGRNALTNLIPQLKQAKTIDVGMYLLSDEELIQTLKNVATTATVRLVTDSELLNPSDIHTLQELWDSGVKVYTLHKDRATMHLKTAVIDGRYVWTGSANWTKGALEINAEDMMCMDSPEMAQHYGEYLNDLILVSHSFQENALGGPQSLEVDEAANEFDPTLPVTEPRTNFDDLARFDFPAFTNIGHASYVADEEYQPNLLKLIQTAKQSVFILMYIMPEQKNEAPYLQEVVSVLEDAAKRGVYVYMVLYSAMSADDRLDEHHSNWAEKLRKVGVDVRLALPGMPLHTKTVIVDLAKILVGSHNWSEGALSGKRVYESSALIVLNGQEPKLADFVFSRKIISDMRSRALWRSEILLLRHLAQASDEQRDEILTRVGIEIEAEEETP